MGKKMAMGASQWRRNLIFAPPTTLPAAGEGLGRGIDFGEMEETLGAGRSKGIRKEGGGGKVTGDGRTSRARFVPQTADL